MARQCGYSSITAKGTDRVNLNAFQTALLEAKGVKMNTAPPIKEQVGPRNPVVNKSGHIILSPLYVEELGLQPNTCLLYTSPSPRDS